MQVKQNSWLKGFRAYLKLEKNLSDNSISAYLNDVGKLFEFLGEKEQKIQPAKISYEEIQAFIHSLKEINIGSRSQARIISGLKSFFKYLLIENIRDDDPTEALDSPKIGQKIPDVLSIEEIEMMIAAIDLSKVEGHRNKAIIETLYACGMRVSELTSLQISNLFLDVGFVKVIGKGDKERIVPINESASLYIKIYLEEYRSQQVIKDGHEDTVFLNRRGSGLSRVSVFTIVKALAQKAGIKKKVSPHTFRHSFATHLYEGGADLRAIQDMLGHESITTTEIYSKVNQQYLRETLVMFHPAFND